MEFQSLSSADSFWKYYGGRMGFSTRKKYENKCKQDGVVTSCRFVCAKQGLRGKDKRDHLTKNARAETKTNCKVCMTVKFDRASLTYKVNDLVVEHNQILQTPETAYLLSSQ
jgi:NAD-dependent dihydropyrimidine dehydrogenase PreA subunit